MIYRDAFLFSDDLLRPAKWRRIVLLERAGYHHPVLLFLEELLVLHQGLMVSISSLFSFCNSNTQFFYSHKTASPNPAYAHCTYFMSAAKELMSANWSFLSLSESFFCSLIEHSIFIYWNTLTWIPGLADWSLSSKLYHKGKIPRCGENFLPVLPTIGRISVELPATLSL